MHAGGPARRDALERQLRDHRPLETRGETILERHSLSRSAVGPDGTRPGRLLLPERQSGTARQRPNGASDGRDPKGSPSFSAPRVRMGGRVRGRHGGGHRHSHRTDGGPHLRDGRVSFCRSRLRRYDRCHYGQRTDHQRRPGRTGQSPADCFPRRCRDGLLGRRIGPWRSGPRLHPVCSRRRSGQGLRGGYGLWPRGLIDRSVRTGWRRYLHQGR